jgi:hypothetical protein
LPASYLQRGAREHLLCPVALGYVLERDHLLQGGDAARDVSRDCTSMVLLSVLHRAKPVQAHASSGVRVSQLNGRVRSRVCVFVNSRGCAAGLVAWVLLRGGVRLREAWLSPPAPSRGLILFVRQCPLDLGGEDHLEVVS